MALEDKDKLDYAWNWFEYHAAQRLTAFRYFLVFLGILLIGYNSGLQAQNVLFASAVGCVGAFVSLAFLVLEFRNEELVNVGRDALREIEDSVDLESNSKLRLLQRDRNRRCYTSHKLWLRLIYVLCIVIFAFAAYDPKFVLGESDGGKSDCPTSTRTIEDPSIKAQNRKPQAN